jgi:8-oxo-dGTP diphosphatase
MTPDIRKAGAVLIRDRRLLLTRTRGKEAFVAPGGKLEAGETAIECLARELREELGIGIAAANVAPFGTYLAAAVYDPAKQLEMQVFVVSAWDGEPRPSREVEEVRWVTSAETRDLPVGSIFAHEVIPRLRAEGLID